MPTPEEIADAVKTSAETGIASQSSDGVQTTAHSLKDQRETADWADQRAARNKSTLPMRYGKFRPSGGGE